MPRLKTDHRSWPLPNRPWVMAQTWHDLLFAHWPIEYDQLRKAVPEPLPIDTYDGQARIAVVPFWMSGIRLRDTPALPRVSSFPELNVRTYSTLDGKPGVYFFSLDALNPVAVAVARRLYRLPYFRARMSVRGGPPHTASSTRTAACLDGAGTCVLAAQPVDKGCASSLG